MLFDKLSGKPLARRRKSYSTHPGQTASITDAGISLSILWLQGCASFMINGIGFAFWNVYLMEDETMEQPETPNQEVVTQIQQMLDTPIEDQAATFELALLGGVLQNTLEMLSNAENNQEASEILRSMIKSAFVIGRRHFNQLV